MRIFTLDIGGSSIKSGVASFALGQTTPAIGHVFRHPLPDNSFPALREAVVELVDATSGIDAIAISTTGTLSKDQVVLRSRAFTGYEQVSWSKELARLGHNVPVEVINDGHAVAMAENATAPQADRQNTAHFVIGTGVGGGAIVDGKLLTGAAGYAGAFGHVKVSAESTEVCGCSGTGCVEVLAASPAIERGLEKSGFRGDSLCPEIDRPEDAAKLQAVYAEAGWWLGRAIGSVINVLTPSLVTLGGGVIDADSVVKLNLGLDAGPYLDAAIREARASSLKNAAAVVEIRKSRYGNDAGMIGASIAAFRSRRARPSPG